ncbi:MAG: hypothetical protein ACREGJ_03120 [Candidatus Saccharimonadales bacterium]
MAVPGEVIAPQIGDGDEILRTQISGRYSLDNPGVFAFKRQLVEAGIDVAFPVGDEIIEHSCGFAITVPHEAETPFHTTEVQFLREIRANPLQVTYNIWGDRDGYVGESTGLETAYALLRNKPVVMLREPTSYSSTIAPPIKTLMEKYKGAVLIEKLDRLSITDLAERLAEIALTEVDYGLPDEEVDIVMRSALALTKKYKRDWDQYQNLRRLDAIR